MQEMESRNIKIFYIGFFLIFNGLSILSYFKGGHFYYLFSFIGISFLILGLLAPRLLVPVYRLWMKVSLFIGRVNTVIILTAIYYLLLTPLAVIVRFFRKGIIPSRIDRGVESYWEKRAGRVFSKERYTKQY